MTPADARAALALFATRQLGRPYIWGGDGPAEGGLDCSGFVSDCLTLVARAWPKLYDGRRRTAQGLHSYYRGRGREEITELADLRPCCLLFYSKKRQIFHVAIHLFTSPPLDGDLEVGPVSIEAGGGGSRNTTPRMSLQKPAGVRFSASDTHGGTSWVALDPFTVDQGLPIPG